MSQWGAVAPSKAAVKPKYRALFEPAEIKKCRERLASYEWKADPPWLPPGAEGS